MTKYKREVLSVYDGNESIGFVARRWVVYKVDPVEFPGWCIMKPMVNLWEGNFKTRKEAAVALLSNAKKQSFA